MYKLIKFYYQTLSLLSPKMAANSAFELFKKVRKKDIREREKPFYEKATRQDIAFGPEKIHTYSFGNPEHDNVILIHGWDSNAGSLSKFIAPLLAKNKHVISLNLPAHAQYKSSKTTILECKDAVKTLLNNLPDLQSTSIISHSFGSAVTGYALSEISKPVDKLMFLTSPNKMDVIFIQFKNIIGLNNKAYKILIDKANNILNEDLEAFYVHDKLNKASFNKLTIFHDVNDKIISIKNSRLMTEKVPNSTLKTYENIGHYRMLWNDTLVNDVMAAL